MIAVRARHDRCSEGRRGTEAEQFEGVLGRRFVRGVCACDGFRFEDGFRGVRSDELCLFVMMRIAVRLALQCGRQWEGLQRTSRHDVHRRWSQGQSLRAQRTFLRVTQGGSADVIVNEVEDDVTEEFTAFVNGSLTVAPLDGTLSFF